MQPFNSMQQLKMSAVTIPGSNLGDIRRVKDSTSSKSKCGIC